MNLGGMEVGEGGALQREGRRTVLQLRSLSVDRCRGETEDNFLRRNVREQSRPL